MKTRDELAEALLIASVATDPNTHQTGSMSPKAAFDRAGEFIAEREKQTQKTPGTPETPATPPRVWGTCVDCPIDPNGGRHPRYCVYADRYDHQIPWREQTVAERIVAPPKDATLHLTREQIDAISIALGYDGTALPINEVVQEIETRAAAECCCYYGCTLGDVPHQHLDDPCSLHPSRPVYYAHPQPTKVDPPVAAPAETPKVDPPKVKGVAKESDRWPTEGGWRNVPPSKAELETHLTLHPWGRWETRDAYKSWMKDANDMMKYPGPDMFPGAQDNKQIRPLDEHGKVVPWELLSPAPLPVIETSNPPVAEELRFDPTGILLDELGGVRNVYVNKKFDAYVSRTDGGLHIAVLRVAAADRVHAERIVVAALPVAISVK